VTYWYFQFKFKFKITNTHKAIDSVSSTTHTHTHTQSSVETSAESSTHGRVCFVSSPLAAWWQILSAAWTRMAVSSLKFQAYDLGLQAGVSSGVFCFMDFWAAPSPCSLQKWASSWNLGKWCWSWLDTTTDFSMNIDDGNSDHP
jgi:hypothetical protein